MKTLKDYILVTTKIYQDSFPNTLLPEWINDIFAYAKHENLSEAQIETLLREKKIITQQIQEEKRKVFKQILENKSNLNEFNFNSVD